MHPIYRYLDQLLIPGISRVQLATNSNWEKAWKLNPKQDSYNQEQINQLTSIHGDTTAIEFYYQTTYHTNAYLGLKYSPQLKPNQSPSEFVHTVLSTAFALKYKSLSLLLQNLSRILYRPGADSLTYKPNKIVMGVVDFWLTYDPCTIWDQAKQNPPPANINSIIIKHPNLIHNSDNYTGLEFVYSQPTQHWLSFQVSQLQDQTFVLNQAQCNDLINTIMAFYPS